MKIVNILGVNLHNLSQKKVQQKLKVFLEEKKPHYLTTPNPEIVLAAQKDEEFFYILNHADLNLVDGFGLKIAGWFLGENLRRYSGADLLRDLLIQAEQGDYKVLIVNWCAGLSSTPEIKKSLSDKHPKLKVKIIEIERGEDLKTEKLEGFSPEIMFVALGAPYQEKFIFQNLDKIHSLRIAVGIGGAFDFLTKKIKRAPKLMQILGIEWLWRLVRQPQERKQRAKRIYRAVIKFPLKFIKWRFVLPFLYRANVACLLYKQENNKIYILLVERKDQPGHWQLPQGGTDGEDIEVAGIKELNEEIGTSNFQPEKVFKNLHRYQFDNSFSRHRGAVYKKHAGYKGQKQSLLVARFLGQDQEIKINFWDHLGWKWVEIDDCLTAVHPIRKESTNKFLEKFKIYKKYED